MKWVKQSKESHSTGWTTWRPSNGPGSMWYQIFEGDTVLLNWQGKLIDKTGPWSMYVNSCLDLLSLLWTWRTANSTSTGMCPRTAIFPSPFIPSNKDIKDCALWHYVLYGDHALLISSTVCCLKKKKKSQKGNCKITQRTKHTPIDKNMTNPALWTKIIQKVKTTGTKWLENLQHFNWHLKFKNFSIFIVVQSRYIWKEQTRY